MKMEQNKETSDSSLDQKIIRQVEYYFGDYNLPRDKFLQEQIKLDEGWIPLTTMLNFKRLAALSKDEDVIINALKKSPLKLIEVDEEKKKIRRSVGKPVPEMTESRQKEIQSRTVYCKGFTKENSSLDKLLVFFGQFASIDNVQMRTYLDKATNEYIFKGSVFVVFSTKDDADDFMKKDSVEYEGVKLIVKTQEDYMHGKKKERDEKKKVQKAKVQQATNRQPAGQKSQDEEGKESEEEEEEKGSGFAKGALIHMKNVPKTATWEDIKSAVASVWRDGAKEGEEKEIIVAYVDHRMGAEEGWIRLTEANTAVTLLQRARVVAESKKMETDKEEEEKKTEKVGDEKKTDIAEDEKKTDNVEDEKKTEKVEDEKKKDKVEDGKKTDKADEEKKVDSGGSGDAKADEVNGLEKDKKSSKDDTADVKEGGDKATVKEKGSESEEKGDEVSYMEVGDVLVCIRALHGTEEEEYLERVKEERDQRLQTLSRNKRRGGHGGNRRGRGGRGGKRRNNWEGGPSHKRRR